MKDGCGSAIGNMSRVKTRRRAHGGQADLVLDDTLVTGPGRARTGR